MQTNADTAIAAAQLEIALLQFSIGLMQSTIQIDY